MEKILSELNTDKAKAAAQAAIDSAKLHADELSDAAKEKVLSAAESVKESKFVTDLLVDIEEKPDKVKREAGIAGLAALAVFAGMRFYDTYSTKTDAEG